MSLVVALLCGNAFKDIFCNQIDLPEMTVNEGFS
jgi:hypothetical protein